MKSGTAAVIALLLILSLLFTQCLGLTHSIVHGLPAGAVQVISADSNSASSFLHDASSSCAAFDDACIGASLHTATTIPPLLPGTAVLSLWLAFQSWEPPFQRLFSSRAPPLA